MKNTFPKCSSRINRQSLVSVFIGLLTAFVSCSGGRGIDNDDFTSKPNYDVIQQIQYHYEDATIPPKYHRSYTITIAKNQVNIVINSYENIIANQSYKISNEQFNSILSSMRNHEIGNCELGKDTGCSGGTSESVIGIITEEEIFDGEVYHCGGYDFGDLCGDVTHFAYDVKSLIPNLKELLSLEIEYE